jgi:hypothetical protein
MQGKNHNAWKSMSETELSPVLALLRGENPETIARQAGMPPEHLLRLRDDLLADRAQAGSATVARSSKKIGRNDLCPCGSGKKYKHCCLDRETAAGRKEMPSHGGRRPKNSAGQARLIGEIDRTFGLFAAGRLDEAIRQANRLLKQHPNEDRLHDIAATAHIYAGAHDAAIDICRQRLAAAESEKSYFALHGRYRDADIDHRALSYYYPPITWLQKTWIAVKAASYDASYPDTAESAIVSLVQELQSADDENRFPKTSEQGLQIRRRALRRTLAKLVALGAEAIPYLLPLSVRYSWAGLFVPELLFDCRGDRAVEALIDISMLGFAYASGASLHYLTQHGADVVPHIRAAFSRDKEFDPIKTGIVSVLGNVQTFDAYGLLLDLLRHESPHIVNWAGDALAKYGDVQALPAVVAASERIGGERMIENAIHRLKDLT